MTICRDYLYYYQQIFDLPYIALRYANVYGPRQDPLGEAGVIAIFSQSMLNGKQPIINGPGEQTRDYVYVEDVARINVLALKDGIKGTFNVGTGKETTVNYLFTKIQSLTHAGALEVHGEPKKGEQFRSVLSAEKAKQTLGWEPKVKFDEGLKRTIEFFKAKI